ncbi:MAG TPA: hypothetical protein DCR55_02315 [Lentisphaeria bacterium]|nr:hypothetical protein [Lentisphaeria bacterium]
MRSLIGLGLLASALCGCVTPPRGQPELRQTSWRDSGSRPPTLPEIRKLRATLEQTAEMLRGDLRGDQWERRRAAHILELLRHDGSIAEFALRAAFDIEPDPVNRAFMMRAFANFGEVEDETMASIRRVFFWSEDPVLHTYAAGAIIALQPGGESAEEIQLLADHLNPDAHAGQEKTRSFWEARWASVYMVRKLRNEAPGFLEAVETLSEAPDAPPWVRKEALFTLRALATLRRR